MLIANGFCCSLVDAIEHTREVKPDARVFEMRKWNMASTWIGNEPSEAKPEVPLVIGIYVGQESNENSKTPARMNENDCMVYVFRNGVCIAQPVLLSTLRQSPILLRNKASSRTCLSSAAPTVASFHQTPNYPAADHRRANHAPVLLSELEVIIVTPFTPPKPMMKIEEFPMSRHLAHFRFTASPTQGLDVRGIAILPKDFWVHERELSKEWAPFTRKSLSWKESQVPR